MHEQVCCRAEAANPQLPVAAAFWITPVFCGGMFKPNAKFDADSLLCSLSHFECDGRTVHMPTQRCLPSPLASTVKSSSFTHMHPSPLSLAGRSHWCRTNHSRRINNGWTFSWPCVCCLGANTLCWFIVSMQEHLWETHCVLFKKRLFG